MSLRDGKGLLPTHKSPVDTRSDEKALFLPTSSHTSMKPLCRLCLCLPVINVSSHTIRLQSAEAASLPSDIHALDSWHLYPALGWTGLKTEFLLSKLLACLNNFLECVVAMVTAPTALGELGKAGKYI